MKKLIYCAVFFLIMFSASAQKETLKIKSIVGSIYEQYDTIQNCFQEYYNKFGLLDSSRDNRFYHMIDNRYDEKGRITEQNALYGESFSNGLTNFYYYPDSTVEKQAAMGFYRESVVRFTPEGDTASNSWFFTGTDAVLREQSNSVYIYENKKLTEIKNAHIAYQIPDDFYEETYVTPDSIKFYLKTPPVEKTSEYAIVYLYDSEGRLKEIADNSDGVTKKRIYFYDKKRKSLEKICYTMGNDTSQTIEYQYDKNGKKTKRILKSYSKNEDKELGTELPAYVSFSSETVFQYGKKGNLLKIKYSNDGKLFQTDYYKENRILETDEYNAEGKLSGKIIYKYEYYK